MSVEMDQKIGLRAVGLINWPILVASCVRHEKGGVLNYSTDFSLLRGAFQNYYPH
jgi:hypothetical protein